MGFLFWLLWAIDLATCITLYIAGDFRQSFTANNPNGWVAVMFLLCVIGSLVSRFPFNRQLLSLMVAALPVLVMLFWYMIDRINNPPS